jgi:hypothetical protein
VSAAVSRPGPVLHTQQQQQFVELVCVKVCCHELGWVKIASRFLFVFFSERLNQKSGAAAALSA